MTLSVYPRCSIQNTLSRRMSFDLNQFDNDDDATGCFDCDIEAQWEEALKQFDVSTFAFEDEEKEEEKDETNIKMEERVDYGIQNTLQRKMSFDIKQFDDLFDYEVKVEDEEKEEGNNRRCHALAEEIVRIGKINDALNDHLKVLNILKKTKNKRKSTLTRINKSTIRLEGLLGDNNYSNNTTTANVLNNEKSIIKKDEDFSTSENITPMKLVSNNASPPSLYEQHKELLRQRYSVSSSSSSFSSTTTEASESSSPSLLSSSLNGKDEDKDGFSLQLQNAIRTSSSFVHLQQRKNVSTAFAA